MTISYVIIVDTETDDTDEGAQCIEVGCSLYSVEDAAVMTSFSSLIRAESNAAEHVNGISVALLR